MADDKKYVPTAILDTYPHRAMRYAVLAPLVGSADYIKHDIPKMLSLLRNQWSARISAMAKEAQWKPAMGKGHYYLRNCPPFGVKTDDTFRRCKQRRICPFCYAREFVLNPFLSLEWACYGTFDWRKTGTDGVQRRVDPINATLIEFVKTYSFPRPGVNISKVILPNVVKAQRQEEWNSLEGLGAFASTIIEPYKDRVQVTRRGVIVAANDQVLTESPGLTVSYHRPVTRKTLVDVIGRTCRYPQRMMRCDPKDAAVVLDKWGGAKGIVYYGSLRNGAYRVKADKVV